MTINTFIQAILLLAQILFIKNKVKVLLVKV